MAVLTNFGLYIDIYMVNSKIFMKKKNLTNFFWISFNEFLKGTTILIPIIL